MHEQRIGILLGPLIALVACLPTRLMADDAAHDAVQNWPQWRGPTWNGVAAQADPPVTWSETENLRWKTPIEGSGYGTPIVWGDRIFLQTAIALDKQMPIPDVIPADTPNINKHPQVVGSWKPQQFVIVCLDRITGKQLWSRMVHEAMPHQGHHNKGGFASASPVTDGQHIYAYFGSFGLYCYDFEGRFVWKRDFEPQAIEDSLGEGSSPALFGDTLVIAVDSERQSFVVAIDKRTGEDLWKQDRDETSNWSTPRIFTHAGRRQVLINGATVRSYDLTTGELLWECGGHTDGAIPMPAVGHGLAFTASGWRRDMLQAIELGQRGDLTGTESVAWSLRRGVPYVPCPMLWGDELYLLEDQTFFTCLNATDGAQHYLKHRLPGGLNFSASPVGAADRIYLLSEEGRTVVLQRGPQLRVLAINDLDERFHASPAIVGDAIYLRGFDHLFCFARPDQPATVQSLVDRVSEEHYRKYQLDVESMGLGLYGGSVYDMGHRSRDYHTQTGASLGNKEAALYLQDAFKAMGLSVTAQGTYQNVVAELTGTKTPEKVYILGAHFDHLEGDKPGGDDNASGTAGLLEAARVLSQCEFESTIRFIAFNAEEDGLLGSTDYVAKITSGENIVGMINMDMILRPGSDTKPDFVINVEVETNGSMPWVKAYVKAVADHVPSLAVGNLWDERDSTSDNDPFQAAGIPAMLIIENSFGDWYPPDPIANTYYHTYEDASDRLANDPNSPSGVTYDYGFATDVTRSAVALLAQEALLRH